MCTHEEVSDDEGGEDDGHAEDLSLGPHAVVERLYPLPAEDAEHHHERVEEVAEVPSRHRVPSETTTDYVIKTGTAYHICMVAVTLAESSSIGRPLN